MKFSIANLGRIQDATLDIKPLTVFLGKNGTHKTWALHCLHGLLSDRADMNAVRPRIGDGEQAALREITERAVAGLSDGRERHAFPRGQVLNAFGTEVTFVIEHMIASFVGVHVAGRATLVQPTADLRSEGLLTVTRSGRLGTDLEIGTDEESIVPAGVPSDPVELSTFLSYWIAGIATRRRARVYVLPAERLGFPFAKESGDRLARRWSTLSFSQLMVQRSAGTVADAFERAVGVAVTFEDGKEPAFFEAGAPLNYAASASLLKANVGIAAFLAAARPGDTLLIDEPEMNAHPASQVKLAELFAWMIRQGYRLVLATHSPYLVDHLCTLLEFGSLGEKRAAAVELAKARRIEAPPVDAYLLPEEVAAYEFGTDGVVRDVFNRKTHRIDWATFTKVSENEGMLFDTLLDVEFGGDRDE